MFICTLLHDDGDNLYDVVGGDGQPSGGSEATGLRAETVYDYQTGMCNVKCSYRPCVCYVSYLKNIIFCTVIVMEFVTRRL